MDSIFVPNLNTKHNTYSMPRYDWTRKLYGVVKFRKLLRKTLPHQIVKQVRGYLFTKRNKPVLSDDLRDQLIKLYSDDLKQLGKLLNLELTKWTK